MEAIILAGGFGTRLKTVVKDLPKPMALVAGRPFLSILLELLARNGFSRIILSLGYKAEIVVEHFGNSFAGMELVYEIEDSARGTGGAIQFALRHCRDDHVFVFNGDTFLDLEVDDVESLWRANRKPVIVTRQASDAFRYGLIESNSDRVIGFSEKNVAGPGMVNAGCYVLPVNIFDGFEKELPFSIEADFFSKEVKHHFFNIFITDGYFIDIGIPEDYERAQTELEEFCE